MGNPFFHFLDHVMAKPKNKTKGTSQSGKGATMSHDLDVVNERLYRLETEVDTVKSDLNDQKVAVARLSEQVTSHEKRGEERHQQLLTTLGEMKTDYRTVLQQQTQHLQERSAFQNKLILGILGILSTVAGGIYGLSPSKEAAKEAASPPPPAEAAPASELP
jgi:hypothetical protein